MGVINFASKFLTNIRNTFLRDNNNLSFGKQMKQQRIIRISTYTGLVVVAIYAICFINPPFRDDASHAATHNAVASDTILSLSIENSSLALNLTPVSANGTFMSTADTENHAVINVATNNITGYTLSIQPNNSDTARNLVSTGDRCVDTPTADKCFIETLTESVSKEDYEASTATDLNNTWGYLPSKYNSVDNTNYLPAPTANGDILDTTDAPNTLKQDSPVESTDINDLEENEYTIDLGSRVDYSTYADSYTNTFIITAVGNLVPYSVTYNANKPEQAPATANVDNIPRPQTGTVSSGNTIAVVLDTKVPTIGNENPNTGEYTYAGYVFNGWCNAPTETPAEIAGPNNTTITNTQGYQICPEGVEVYQPGDNYGINQTEAINTETLYAIWGAPAKVIFHSNGLIYDNDTTNTENTVQYIPTYAENKITGTKTNTIYTGTYKTPAYEETTPTTNYIFKGWNGDRTATEATCTNEQEITEDLTLSSGDNIELYAIWNYATKITFNKNNADGTETMAPQYIEVGTTAPLEQNAYTNTGYILSSWNTAADGSGTSYPDQGDFQTTAEQPDVMLYAQWEVPCNANSICYLPNGANEGENDPKMSAQTANYSDNTDPITSNMAVNLWPSNYKYDTTNDTDTYNDYGFAGWSEDKNAAAKILDTDPDNNPTIYGPNQNITLGDVSTKGLKLYAVWMPVAKSSTGTELTFQTTDLLTTTLADDTTLASKSNGYVTALKDQRDNQVYAVAKLADDNYWMIENLRLDNNPEQPNWGNNALSQGFGGVFQGLAGAESSNFSSSAAANSLYSTGNITGGYQVYRFPRYNNINTTAPAANMTAYNNDTNVYSLGNYYTWAAAIADTTAYTSSGGHTDVKTSICPAGWHLPYSGSGTSGTSLGNTSGGFYYLNNKINNGTNATDASSSKAWRSFPNNFMYSGLFIDSAASNRAKYGYYWTTSAFNRYNACVLDFFGSSNVSPGTYCVDKYYGHAVRCVVGE